MSRQRMYKVREIQSAVHDIYVHTELLYIFECTHVDPYTLFIYLFDF